MIAVCWFGSFVGDVIRFYIGRRFDTRWLGSVPKIELAMRRVSPELTSRHYVWMILLHRYPHGIRGLAGFAYGMSPLPQAKFLAMNFIAAGLWSCIVVLAGYAFGQVSEKLLSDASSGLGLVMLVAFLGLSWVLSKKLERVVIQQKLKRGRRGFLPASADRPLWVHLFSEVMDCRFKHGNDAPKEATTGDRSKLRVIPAGINARRAKNKLIPALEFGIATKSLIDQRKRKTAARSHPLSHPPWR